MWQGDFTNALQVRILRRGDYPGGSRTVTRVLLGRKIRGREDVKTEAEVREKHCIAAFEGGGRGHEPRHVGCLAKLEKARKQIAPPEPSEGMEPF